MNVEYYCVCTIVFYYLYEDLVRVVDPLHVTVDKRGGVEGTSSKNYCT